MRKDPYACLASPGTCASQEYTFSLERHPPSVGCLQPSLLQAGTGRRSAGVLTSDLAKALNLLSIFCLLGSCRTQHNDTHILVGAPLPDHPSRGLCELHICELWREEDHGAVLT